MYSGVCKIDSTEDLMLERTVLRTFYIYENLSDYA